MYTERDKRIVTVKKSDDGILTLKITRENYQIEDGERFKIVNMEDGFQLRRLEEPCDTIERIWMDKECGKIFDITMQRYPKSNEDINVLQLVMQRSFLYTWMKRLIGKLGVEVEDMQPLLALYQKEIDEYKSVMDELKRS